MKRKDLLKIPVEHIDISKFDSTEIIESMSKMSFSSRDTANAAFIFEKMIGDPDCSIILTLAGSTGAAGCMKIYSDMILYNMVDAVVATGASVVDMDFFEALGFRHYIGTQFIDDRYLRKNYIDRIYDTYIDEKELQKCDQAVCNIADGLKPGIYSSRAFIKEMGKYAVKNSKKKNSLVQLAYENNVPVFYPAFFDSIAGFGLCMYQENKK
ncbi:deoxyhypusine synthase family protein, partial [Candidatus Dependentiae bacterium]|nr:deoxyhypusine synthase family protein [Candidatus Dependentiae bacterium]